MYQIFIVDDDQRVVNALKELLEAVGEISVVGNADNEDASVEWLVQNRTSWNLTIVDLALRVGSGLRVLSACRVRLANQKVVVLSGHLDSAMKRRCETLGADAVFAKDTHVEALLDYCASASGMQR